MKLGERIYNRMKNIGITQAQLSRKAGITQQAISRYICNRSKPGYNSIMGMMKGLEVESAWFFKQADEELIINKNLEELV